jgi:hypothetical protein
MAVGGLDDVGASTWTCLPWSSSWRAQLAVNSALPMNDERNLTPFDVDIDNNFFDESADDALLQAHVGVGGVPGPRQIGTECPEVISVWLDLLLDLRPTTCCSLRPRAARRSVRVPRPFRLTAAAPPGELASACRSKGQMT